MIFFLERRGKRTARTCGRFVQHSGRRGIYRFASAVPDSQQSYWYADPEKY